MGLKEMKAELRFSEEFVDQIADQLIERLKPMIHYSGNGNHNAEDIIFDIKGLSEYLHVTPKWIHERTHLKNIPFYKLSNKQLRFRKSDIDKWLDSLKTPTVNQFTGRLKVVNG
jgi:hypothetical protein